MNTELETIMLCLQRRYNILREIGGLTDELAEAVERRDDISASLLLKMRGEQMERHAACQEELICLTEQNPAIRKQLQAVALGPIIRKQKQIHRKQGTGRKSMKFEAVHRA